MGHKRDDFYCKCPCPGVGAAAGACAYPGAVGGFPGAVGGFPGAAGGYGGSPCIVPFAGYSGGTCFENGELLIAIVLLLCLCGGFGGLGGICGGLGGLKG